MKETKIGIWRQKLDELRAEGHISEKEINAINDLTIDEKIELIFRLLNLSTQWIRYFKESPGGATHATFPQKYR